MILSVELRLIPQIAVDNAWTSIESIGQYYPGNDGTGGALRRGGHWLGSSFAGLFTTSMHNEPTASTTSIGFRCAVLAP
ncbi:MAG: hypothetical protein HRU09_19675 [Oligoflexales bacterium]|nr:hypothetical protein [Oligoflexales bacterium]